MNICLFVDTNVYLRLYDSKQSNYKKLLTSLNEIRESIFINQLIIDEINRNKENVFIRSFNGYIEQSKVNNITLPDHISSVVDAEIKKWNDSRKNLAEIVTSSKADLLGIRDRILSTISNGNDEIYSVISAIPVFDYSDNDFNSACKRKKIGNPPGKREDPLGDQLNWESLMRFVIEKNIDVLIMVSLDSDFFVTEIDTPILNAVLNSDIKQVRPDLIIHCYKNLSDALKKFNDYKVVNSLPQEVELQQIKKEETKTPVYWKPFMDLNLSSYSSKNMFEKEIFETCENCKKFGPFKSNGIILREERIFTRYECENCNSVLFVKS